MRIAKLKSAYKSLIIRPKGLQGENQLIGNHGLESSDVVRFYLGSLLQGETRVAKLKVLITCLLLVLEFWDVKPTCRKSWAGNLVMWSDLTLGPSFKVK